MTKKSKKVIPLVFNLTTTFSCFSNSVLGIIWYSCYLKNNSTTWWTITAGSYGPYICVCL